jgi:hypothetical protein
MRVGWGDARDCFIWDGAWIDLYAFEIGPEHWKRMFKALEAAGYGLKWSDDVPEDLSELAGRSDPVYHLAYIKVGSAITLSVFHFDPETIEITIDPREITGPEDFAILCGAVETIASAIGTAVVMCPENFPQGAFLSYAPTDDRWTFLPWPRAMN